MTGLERCSGSSLGSRRLSLVPPASRLLNETTDHLSPKLWPWGKSLPQATASMKYQIDTFHLAMKMARISPQNANDSYRDNVGYTLSMRWSTRGDTVQGSTVRVWYGMIRYGYDTIRFRYTKVTTPYGYSTIRLRRNTVMIQYGYDTIRLRYHTVMVHYGTLRYNTDYY